MSGLKVADFEAVDVEVIRTVKEIVKETITYECSSCNSLPCRIKLMAEDTFDTKECIGLDLTANWELLK